MGAVIPSTSLYYCAPGAAAAAEWSCLKLLLRGRCRMDSKRHSTVVPLNIWQMNMLSPVLFLSFWLGSILYNQNLCSSNPEDERWPPRAETISWKLIIIGHKMLHKLQNGFIHFWVLILYNNLACTHRLRCAASIICPMTITAGVNKIKLITQSNWIIKTPVFFSASSKWTLLTSTIVNCSTHISFLSYLNNPDSFIWLFQRVLRSFVVLLSNAD